MLLPLSLAVLITASLSQALPLSSPSSSSSTIDRRSQNVNTGINAGDWKLSKKRDIGFGLLQTLGLSTSSNNDEDDDSIVEDSSFLNNDDDSTSNEEQLDQTNEEEEGVFDPSTGTFDGKAVVRNPKVIPNPKNPNFTKNNTPTSTTSSSPTTTSTTTTSPAVTTTASSMFKGQATYFFQNGVAGACGKVNPDSANIVALDYRLYGNLNEVSKYCGRSLTIRNIANGKTVVATVADACPTCDSKYSLDLSEGAFGLIGEYDTGILPIEWSWNA